MLLNYAIPDGTLCPACHRRAMVPYQRIGCPESLEIEGRTRTACDHCGASDCYDTLEGLALRRKNIVEACLTIVAADSVTTLHGVRWTMDMRGEVTLASEAGVRLVLTHKLTAETRYRVSTVGTTTLITPDLTPPDTSDADAEIDDDSWAEHFPDRDYY